MDASALPNHSLGHQKKTTIFCFGNKRRFENSHPEASEPTHISADKFNKTKNHTTKTQQPSRPSNRSEPEALKQCAIVKHCGVDMDRDMDVDKDVDRDMDKDMDMEMDQ